MLGLSGMQTYSFLCIFQARVIYRGNSYNFLFSSYLFEWQANKQYRQEASILLQQTKPGLIKTGLDTFFKGVFRHAVIMWSINDVYSRGTVWFAQKRRNVWKYEEGRGCWSRNISYLANHGLAAEATLFALPRLMSLLPCVRAGLLPLELQWRWGQWGGRSPARQMSAAPVKPNGSRVTLALPQRNKANIHNTKIILALWLKWVYNMKNINQKTKFKQKWFNY